MTMLEIALACIRRGWHVFPCKGKKPLEEGGYKTASNNEAKVREWWARYPDANVAIAPGPSGITVLDVDTGLTSEEDLRAFYVAHDIPETFAVRTGKRPDFRIQLYFTGIGVESFNGWKQGQYGGDVRGTWGHVMAPGCIHPESGAVYEVLWDLPLAPLPNFVRALKAARKERTLDPNEPITEWRNDAMIHILGKYRADGADDEMLRFIAYRTNETRMRTNPLDEEELEYIIANACKWPIGEPDPIAMLGTPREPEPPRDWRERYLTFEQVRDAKPTSFFIQGFLAVDSITALAAPVGQRKSLIALNVGYALCTGEPLFDYFKVVKQPQRVVYLCPEMSLSSFSTRLKGIGLLDYVGKTLFCQTMDDTSVHLSELNEELPGAVVIIDTLTRFVEGDQNSSEDMSKFAQEVFRLKRAGATVLLLHHSVKGAGNFTALTLDSAMRGSTELAAFVTSCWATKLNDPEDPYNSPSLLVNVKQRDFESKPFEVTSGPDCRLHIVGEPEQVGEIKKRKDLEAEQVLAALLKDSPNMGINKIRDALKHAGFRKGAKWVTHKRTELASAGVTLAAE